MEYVDGVPITEYCDKNGLDTLARLQLIAQTCDGVQHAHEKAIIHRDIKPSNVLVTVVDGKPVPKIIDFGVAKAMGQSLTDATMYTQAGALVGTLEYMSPEQLDMTGDVDTRSGVCSLGALLTRVARGTPPIRSEGHPCPASTSSPPRARGRAGPASTRVTQSAKCRDRTPPA
jgi:serine/threonine protein kinase